ncbi:MAG TPA: SGNH/GDSL hydrolase family protein [Bacillota bacterium]|nr:SGNH/GDSL hydrolase family protein [Bacillota bacterium]
MVIIIAACTALLVLLAAFEAAWIMWYGHPTVRPDISHQPQTIGGGKALTFAVLGDSTAVAQGGVYAEGYAVAAANHLAKTHTITWVNEAVSGARAKDAAGSQANRALPYKPDVVLIVIGANDVTHLTPVPEVRASVASAIGAFQQVNGGVRIVLAGSPDMGSPTRIPQPLRLLAGKRTRSINNALMSLADGRQVVFAPIAAQTGPIFRAHPELFASDHFHPNAAGYKLWIPIINSALDKALQVSP